MRKQESLSSIYPAPEPGKPTYWGKPITIPGLGKVGLEVYNFREDTTKTLTGLRFVLRNGETSIDLGSPRAPMYGKGDSDITHGHNLSPSVPEKFFETHGEDPYSHEAIFTGFASRTLGKSLEALKNSIITPEHKDPISLFLFLKTLSTLKTFHEAGIVHADLHPENIIVDDSLQAVRLIDIRNSREDIIKDLRNIVQIPWDTIVQTVLRDAEIGITYPHVFGLSNENTLKKTDELITLAKTRLAAFGYNCDTQEEQNQTAERLADSYRKVQILGSFTVDDTGPILPLPTDKQYEQLIAAMDKLVAKAPTVTFPENQKGWRWWMRHILPPR